MPEVRSSARAALVACAVSAAFYGTIAASLPFYDKGEPREALAVQAMLRGDGAILTRPDGRHVQSKPPLFHWMAAAASLATGESDELAMRLPSIVMGALGVALTVWIAARERGVAAAILSGIVLGSSFEWLRAATQSRVDMVLTFFIVAATWAWRRGTADPAGARLVRTGHLAAAAAVLTKGPVGAVLPALVVGVDALRRRQVRSLARLIDVPAIAAATLVCVGWYVLAWTRGGSEFASRQLVHENIQRFVGWGTVAHRHAAPYYAVALAGAFMPWTIALPFAAWRAWRRPHAGDGFLLVWIVTVVAFYSLAAGKRSTYLLPIFPPLAIVTGTGLAAMVERNPRSPSRAALVMAGGAVLAAAVVFLLDLGAPAIERLAPLIGGSDRARLPAALAVVHAERATIAATLAVVAASLFAIASPRTGATARVAAVVAVALTFTAGLSAFGTYPVARRLTTRGFAERVAAHLRPGDRLCACGDLEGSLRFYLGQPVPRCSVALARGVARRSSAIQADRTDTHGGPHHYRVRAVHEPGTETTTPCVASRPSDGTTHEGVL